MLHMLIQAVASSLRPGLYPKKSAIAAGSDAAVTIIDPEIEQTLRMADLHVRNYSPREGWQVEGWGTRGR